MERQALKFYQSGKKTVIFVEGQYPLTDADAQRIVNQGSKLPSEIIRRLHVLGMLRLFMAQDASTTSEETRNEARQQAG